MDTLATARLLLRPWRDDDLAPFAALNADPRVREFFYPTLFPREESDALAARIRDFIDVHGFGIWAVEVPGVAPFIGMAGLFRPIFEAPFTPCTEVGWRLAPAHWGKGYATEAAAASLAYGFERLKLSEVVAFTAVGNARSRRVMEKLGMSRSSNDDFEHPRLPIGHPLRPHVLYRASAGAVTTGGPRAYGVLGGHPV